MRKPALLIGIAVSPILFAACLGQPDDVDTPAPVTTTATTPGIPGAGENTSNGEEAPAGAVDTTPAVTVTETNGVTATGCPNIPDGAPGLESPIPDDDASRLVGLDEKLATACAEGEGWNVRVISKDGEDFMVTADYRADRVNLTVVDGVVTTVIVG